MDVKEFLKDISAKKPRFHSPDSKVKARYPGSCIR